MQIYKQIVDSLEIKLAFQTHKKSLLFFWKSPQNSITCSGSDKINLKKYRNLNILMRKMSEYSVTKSSDSRISYMYKSTETQVFSEMFKWFRNLSFISKNKQIPGLILISKFGCQKLFYS